MGSRAQLPLILASFLLIDACAGLTSPSAPSSGGTLTVASWQEPESLLAGNITGGSSHAWADVNPVMEGLLRIKAAEDVPKNPKNADYWEPQLATSVPTFENGDVKVTGNKMDVTWKLRHDVRWHDGQPFSSRDLKATFDLWWLKYGNNNPSPLITTSGWDQVESVSTPDDYTAVVHFKSVYGPYLVLGTGPYGILPDHLLELVWSKSGDITKEKLPIAIPGAYTGVDTFDRWLVGTGPFMFKEWVTGDHLTLVRNPRWWGPHRAYLERIVIKFEPDTNSQLADLRTNSIDLGLGFQASLLSPLSHFRDVHTATVPVSGAEKIDFNLHRSLLSDVAVRRAILMGIDRQKIIDTLLEGRTRVPADSWLCIGTGNWCADSGIPRARYDPAAAAGMLDAAGYRVNASRCGAGIRADAAGHCLELSLQTTAGNALREQQEIVIASDLKLIGVKIRTPFANPRAGQLFGSYQDGGVLYTHAFDMAMYTLAYGGPAEPDTLGTSYVSSQIPSDANGGTGQNDTFTSDPRIDRAFELGRTAVSQSARRQAYIDAEKVIAEIVPEVPLYQQLIVIAYTTRLRGYRDNEFAWLNNTEDYSLSF